MEYLVSRSWELGYRILTSSVYMAYRMISPRAKSCDDFFLFICTRMYIIILLNWNLWQLKFVVARGRGRGRGVWSQPSFIVVNWQLYWFAGSCRQLIERWLRNWIGDRIQSSTEMPVVLSQSLSQPSTWCQTVGSFMSVAQLNSW